MRYKDIASSVTAQLLADNGHRVVPFIVGKPGGGKSTVCREIAANIAKAKKIPNERIIEFNPSLREPCDIMGLPDTKGEYSRWCPPEEFYRIRKGEGPSILILEELSDATMDMQNPLCRVILDRFAGNMALSDELYIIASGNRTEDRSGASRLSTKLANRMRTIEFQENLDDWVSWASDHGINPTIIGFLRWKPNLLSDFDPTRSVNPTPRSWEDVSRIPETFSVSVFLEHVKGAVGEGAAAEYTGFLKIVNTLPDWDVVKADPANAPLPADPATVYAVCCRIAQEVTKTTLPKMWMYVERLAKEYQVVFWKMAPKPMRDTKLFQTFARENIDMLAG